MKRFFRKYYTCPHCGNAICGQKREYFSCPQCRAALCNKKDIKSLKDTFCTNCGYDLSSAKREAIALLKEEEIG